MEKVNFNPINHPTANVLGVACWVIIKRITPLNRKKRHLKCYSLGR